MAHEIKNPLNFVNNFSAVSVELIDELREALAGAHLDSKLRAEIGERAGDGVDHRHGRVHDSLDDRFDHGLDGLVNLFGIESPGLTASPAIAAHVIAMLGEA